MKFALDTNCIIELDEMRTQADELRQLSEMAKVKKVQLSVLGISASENQQGGNALPNFSDFTARLNRLDLSHLDILKPIGFWDVTYWDWCLSDQQFEIELLDKLWKVMFPKTMRDWQLFAANNNLVVDDKSTKTYKNWINSMCDAQIAWATINYEQDALITLNTKDFQKNRIRLKELGLNNILSPREAVEFMQSNSN